MCIRDSLNWIDGSATVADDLDDTYTKRIRCKFDGTDWLIVSDISGQNSNGKWLKQASGYQKCEQSFVESLTTSNPIGAIFFVTGTIRTYAKAFISNPNVIWSCTTVQVITPSSQSQPNTVTCQLLLQSGSAAHTSSDNSYTAIGSWY
jgi:hypothetical protein